MIHDLLREAFRCGASDLHLTVGLPPALRINGSLFFMQQTLLGAEDTANFLTNLANEKQQAQFAVAGEIDFAYTFPNVCRFRVNAFRQRKTVAMAIRMVPNEIPTLEKLGLPEVVKNFSRKSRGLVLVSGPTGSGKSTTLAAMIDFINHERCVHIITLEDPIEYLHSHNLSIVHQREIHTDTKSFAAALRATLREDPDVILVGEMRDLETISTVITAAETGHLVLATLHTGDAVETIDRMIDVFPPYQQQQIRMQLSLTLQGVIAQQLLLKKDQQGRVAALEILIANHAVRNLIREGKTQQLASVMQTGAKMGMQTLDMSLHALYRTGTISYEEALAHCAEQDAFSRLNQRA